MLLPEPPASVRVRQVQSKLNLLQPDLDRAGVPNDCSGEVSSRLEELAASVDGGSLESLTVAAVTESILANLTAASTRLGRALGLGFDLANTCKLPEKATREAFLHLFGARIVGVQEALADLVSSLPEHAARGVSVSLATWQQWASNPELSKRPVVWPHDGVRDALARQGQVWRAVLSGEKLGKDMLAADDYLTALKTLARRLFTGRPVVWILLGLCGVAVAGGVYLLIAQKGLLNKVSGSVLSGLGVVGVSAASLKRSFADVAKELEAQVWGAEVDFAIADAITVPPGDWRVKLKRSDAPPPRGLDPNIAANARIVHKIAKAISDPGRPAAVRTRRVRMLLRDDCVYQPASEPVVSEDVARHLVSRRFLGSDPEQLAAGAPGRLVSLHHDEQANVHRALVWTFSQARLVHLHELGDYAAARQAARDPWLVNDGGEAHVPT
ncbi:MAG: hypothetical protein M3Z27_09955 [Actinomycetota bacterium]|nr:hypothetical protein [Actinomycetota bacterium]